MEIYVQPCILEPKSSFLTIKLGSYFAEVSAQEAIKSSCISQAKRGTSSQTSALQAAANLLRPAAGPLINFHFRIDHKAANTRANFNQRLSLSIYLPQLARAFTTCCSRTLIKQSASKLLLISSIFLRYLAVNLLHRSTC